MNNKESSPEKDGFVRVEKKSALPLWGAAAVWVAAGLFFPMYMWYHYLICALVSTAAGLIISKAAPPVVTYEKIPVSTGIAELDEILRKIEEVCTSLSKAEGAGGNAANEISGISLTLKRIGENLRDDPGQIDGAGKLFSYYMPVIQKLSEKYVYFKDAAAGEDSTPEKSAAEIEKAFSLISKAMTKYYDSMFSDDALDISTDIDVLETMLKNDSLI